MTSIEAYKQFELKINGLDGYTNLDIGPGEFVLLFSEWQNKWVRSKVLNRSTTHSLEDVAYLLEHDRLLTDRTEFPTKDEYTLPENFLKYELSYLEASQGTCKERVMTIVKVKPGELRLYLDNTNTTPSFDYQETLASIEGSVLKVQKRDFEIDKMYLSYYRFPKQIDIAGYVKLDGTPSVNIDPEMPDTTVMEIIDLCVTDVQRRTENMGGFQLAKERASTNPG